MGSQEGINVPLWHFIVFQQRDGQDSQNLANHTFYRAPVTSAQCIIGTERYHDSANLLNYNDDDYSQGYGLIEEAFRALTMMLFFSLINLIMISDRLTMERTLDIIYTFSMYGIRKFLNMLNQ